MANKRIKHSCRNSRKLKIYSTIGNEGMSTTVKGLHHKSGAVLSSTKVRRLERIAYVKAYNRIYNQEEKDISATVEYLRVLAVSKK